MKRIYFISLILIGFISCEKVIPFEGEVAVSKLVINSLFQSDSTFKVHVSSSKSVIDTASFQNIEDAVVAIRDKNGNIIENLVHDSNGFYKGQTFPNNYQTYQLVVSHINYNNISAIDSLPAPIFINNVDTTTLADPINGDRLEITLNFDDPGNIQNYYLIETYAIFESLLIKDQDTIESELDTTQQYMLLTDEVFQNGGSPWREQGLFNDLLFDGQTKALTIEIPNDNYSGSEDGYEYSYQTKGLRIYLHNISPSYYYYRTSLELYQQSSGNPFAQPVQVFSNINNGFGVFAGAQVNYFDYNF
ncbi:MAG: DUF4249 domain-containing protein [Parvicellaceae bacterium]